MTAGSHGDVAPFTGLGHSLTRAGHGVTLATHARFAPLAAAAGVGFHPLSVDPRAELAGARGRAMGRSVTAAGKLARLTAMARALLGRMADDLLTAARSADVLLVSGSLAPLGHTIAQGLGLPSICLPLQPLAATREFAPSVVGTGSWGATGNRLAGHVVNAAVETVFADTNRRLRAELGLPRVRSGAARRSRDEDDWPVLHGFSPLVVPRPRDWRSGVTVAGYWWPHDPPGTGLPPRLADFLAAGPPPVFVGLGSATMPRPAQVSATVVRALRAAGLRGVIQRGWGGLDADEADMFTIDDVPHSALFPHMAAVVHHAGAGTTAAGLRAGVPAVPLPVQFDAGFWAARLVRLGVAPRSLPLRRLTADALTAALVRAVDDPIHRQRARDLASRLGAEDGARPVAAALGRLAGT